MCADRLQIGRVFESASDLQGEGQAPAGKCTVSYLHTPNGWRNRGNAELAFEKIKIKLRREEKIGVAALFARPSPRFRRRPVNGRLSATAESLHESVQTTCLLINVQHTQFGTAPCVAAEITSVRRALLFYFMGPRPPPKNLVIVFEFGMKKRSIAVIINM